MPKKKTGIIVAVHDLGTMWSIDVAEKFEKGKPVGKIEKVYGDWRPMRDGLNSAFDISSDKFPYVSSKKIYENVIGQMVEFTPESWRPLHQKAFSMIVDAKGKLKLKTVT